MDRCPICRLPIDQAVVVCSQCGEELPLRVVVISEGSDGESLFAVVRSVVGSEDADESQPSALSKEEHYEQCVDNAGP